MPRAKGICPHKKYLRQKRKYAYKKGIECSLTLSDLHVLLHMARITIKDIGRGNEDYCLGRIGDIGNYERGNCRFITNKQNRDEAGWVGSAESREHLNRIRKGNNGGGIKKGQKLSPYHTRRIRQGRGLA